MTYTDRAYDGETLRDVCLMAKEMWLADQQIDDMLIDWDRLNDIVHQTLATSAATRVGVSREAWRALLERYRAPGQTMLQLCQQARASAS